MRTFLSLNTGYSIFFQKYITQSKIYFLFNIFYNLSYKNIFVNSDVWKWWDFFVFWWFCCYTQILFSFVYVSMANHLITITDLTWGYDDSPSLVFDHFNFHLDQGEFVVLSGKSGAGKSSLVKLLLGQVSAPAKSLYHKGEDLARYSYDEMQIYRRNIGIVFQDHKLLEWLSAKDNILYPLRIAQTDPETTEHKLNAVVELLHLQKYIDTPVQLLSG